MNIKKIALMVFTAAGLSSAALADGFSATLGSDIVPTDAFSIKLGLNYSYEFSPRVFVGGRLNASWSPNPTSTFGVDARLGVLYVASLAKDTTYFVDGYVGAGVNMGILPSPINFSADVRAGVDAVVAVGAGFKLYGGLAGTVGYNFTGSFLPFDVTAVAGVFFEPIQNLEWRLQGGVGFGGTNLASGFRWSANTSLYYTFVPEFKAGINVGYGSGGFTVGIGMLFAQKPGTLGIAGSYLP